MIVHRASSSYAISMALRYTTTATTADMNWDGLGWKSQLLKDPPAQVMILKSPISAKLAAKRLMEGVGIIWSGDYHNGKSFLSLISKHVAINTSISNATSSNMSLKEIYLQRRYEQAMQSIILSRLLVHVQPGTALTHLIRAPDLRAALQAAYGDTKTGYYIPLREVLGAIGSWEWRKKGVLVPILKEYIYPHFGVFCPTVRNDYLKLMSVVPISNKMRLAYDIGVGTGVLSAILVKRGVDNVVATDISDRALVCAEDNLTRLGLRENVTLIKADVFPCASSTNITKKPDLIVCNPPWMPCAPGGSLLDKAIYDGDNIILKRFLSGVHKHLGSDDHCEAFLILSDLAETIGLRSREELLDMINIAKLAVIDRIDTISCHHPRRSDATDEISQARSKEITSLWRLKPVR